MSTFTLLMTSNISIATVPPSPKLVRPPAAVLPSPRLTRAPAPTLPTAATKAPTPAAATTPTPPPASGTQSKADGDEKRPSRPPRPSSSNLRADIIEPGFDTAPTSPSVPEAVHSDDEWDTHDDDHEVEGENHHQNTDANSALMAVVLFDFDSSADDVCCISSK